MWIETFICPFCDKVHTANPPVTRYICKARCTRCKEEFIAVDTLDRCECCDYKVDCIQKVIVMCIESRQISGTR
jgi:hypothetical protein